MDTAKSILVHGVAHQIQGHNFQSYVEDESFGPWIKSLIRQFQIDFVFEEASGRGPSVVEELVRSLQKTVSYLDIDPSANERAKYGIAQRTGDGGPIDPAHSVDVYEISYVGEQKKREEEWLKRIQGSAFDHGLVICGVAHTLSFAFRLQSAGLHVINAYTYIPYSKLGMRS
jgi:hypothetical protein